MIKKMIMAGVALKAYSTYKQFKKIKDMAKSENIKKILDERMKNAKESFDNSETLSDAKEYIMKKLKENEDYINQKSKKDVYSLKFISPDDVPKHEKNSSHAFLIKIKKIEPIYLQYGHDINWDSVDSCYKLNENFIF